MYFHLLRKAIVQQIGHALLRFRHFNLIHYIHILKLFVLNLKFFFKSFVLRLNFMTVYLLLQNKTSIHLDSMIYKHVKICLLPTIFNPLNTELNPICQ